MGRNLHWSIMSPVKINSPAGGDGCAFFLTQCGSPRRADLPGRSIASSAPQSDQPERFPLARHTTTTRLLASRLTPDLYETDHSEVLAVHASGKHSFTKYSQDSIALLEDLGVAGDAHCGVTAGHRHDRNKDPLRPNRRQVHLLQSELLEEVNRKGFNVRPGDMGENITTRNLDLLGLPSGALLHIGDEAVVEVTGLRHPCIYIDKFRKGLLAAVVEKWPDIGIIRKTGVMGIVIHCGWVRPNDAITVQRPNGALKPLEPV
jgi:MOSC domain-containing protein YiiM